jgi:transcriptional regulator of met regulon
MTEAELAAHHEAARYASVADWLALGEEHGKEDALASVVTMTVKNQRAARKMGAQRVRNRVRNLRNAGISEDRIAAWLAAHTAAFVKHVGVIAGRRQHQ